MFDKRHKKQFGAGLQCVCGIAGSFVKYQPLVRNAWKFHYWSTWETIWQITTKFRRNTLYCCRTNVRKTFDSQNQTSAKTTWGYYSSGKFKIRTFLHQMWFFIHWIYLWCFWEFIKLRNVGQYRYVGYIIYIAMIWLLKKYSPIPENLKILVV